MSIDGPCDALNPMRAIEHAVRLRRACLVAALLVVVPARAQQRADAPVETRIVAVANDLEVFHVAATRTASPASAPRAVFLHGACVHGLGYLQAFAFAAASRVSTIALQGDRHCSGIFRSWSSDVTRADRRIADEFRAVGDVRPLEDIVLIGYSQGALIAQRLAQRFPARYPRLILIGQPGGPNARALRRARAVVAMSGTRDNPATMRAGARDLTRIGVPATFISIPGATHGQLGDANALMAQALDWLAAHARTP